MSFIRNYIILLILLFFVSCSDWFKKTETPDTYNPGPGWKLYWSDEFNGTELDMTKWSYDLGAGGWGNDELQGYTSNRENLFLTNGKLVIQVQRNSNDRIPFSSARIHTKNKFVFRYGKVVARIKLPYGKGIWPAFWLMGTNKAEIGWPKCGELDIIEMNGGGEYGDSIVFSSAHWYSESKRDHAFSSWQEINTNPNTAKLTPVPFSEDFHIFTMNWKTNIIETYFENTMIYHIGIDTNREKDMAVFHTTYFLLLNLAVGGNMSRIFMGSMIPGDFPRTMMVDWIRVYKTDADQETEK